MAWIKSFLHWGKVLFCAPKETTESARYFRGAGGTNQGLLALDNPKEVVETEKASRFAKRFFLVSPIYGFAEDFYVYARRKLNLNAKKSCVAIKKNVKL